jgi:hypothetical protein
MASVGTTSGSGRGRPPDGAADAHRHHDGCGGSQDTDPAASVSYDVLLPTPAELVVVVRGVALAAFLGHGTPDVVAQPRRRRRHVTEGGVVDRVEAAGEGKQVVELGTALAATVEVGAHPPGEVVGEVAEGIGAQQLPQLAVTLVRDAHRLTPISSMAARRARIA